MASEVVKTVPAVELSRLDERAREIFRRVVEDYLATGEPVGSRNVSRSLPIALSAASVRNVMSDLEALGLIYAPHTSAGRLPTDLGLRLFVDGILQFGEVSAEDSERIEALARSSGASKNVEGVLSEASALLSGLTRGAGLVVSSKVSPRFRHIEFVRLEADRALVVLVSEDGSVENRVVAMPPGLPASALVEAGNWLNAHIRGRSLEEARKDLETLQAMRQREVDELTQKVVEAGLASVSEAGEGQTPLLIVHGHANLLENLKAMEELERVRLLFEDLERKKDIIHLLNATEQADGVRIFIGSENKLFSLSGSSVVTAPFRDSKHNIVGVIGVIGPTRLNYARIVPMVDYTARLVSKLLT